MSQRKHLAEAHRRLEKAIAAHNIGQVRAALSSGEIVPSASLLEEVFDSAPVAIVEALIDAGAPCEDLLDSRFEKVIEASQQDTVSAKLSLLLRGADLDKLDPPAVWRCTDFNAAMALVLGYGANPDAPRTSKCRGSQDFPTVLLQVLTAGLLSGPARPLLRAGADPRITVSATSSKWPNHNALHLACHCKCPLPIVRAVLDSGRAEVNALAAGRTALSMAVGLNPRPADVVQLLLECGADPNLGEPLKLPLYYALTMADVELTLLLLLHGARIRHDSFVLLCLLRIFGVAVPMEVMRSKYESADFHPKPVWTDANAERLIRTLVPLQPAKLP